MTMISKRVELFMICTEHAGQPTAVSSRSIMRTTGYFTANWSGRKIHSSPAQQLQQISPVIAHQIRDADAPLLHGHAQMITATVGERLDQFARQQALQRLVDVRL